MIKVRNIIKGTMYGSMVAIAIAMAALVGGFF